MATPENATASPKDAAAPLKGTAASLRTPLVPPVQEDVGATGSPDRDSRGYKRGKCKECPNCTGYRRAMGNKKCMKCKCPPGKHRKAGTDGEGIDDDSVRSAVTTPVNTSAHGNSDDGYSFIKCQQCCAEAYFDLNNRKQYRWCQEHLPDDLDSDICSDDGTIGNSFAGTPAPKSVKDPTLCAIEDCGKPRHKDESGKVHECCSASHAILLHHQRGLELMKQPVVKGVTHCLLPGCNKVVWPFMNYCCRTHADKGIKNGLKPPDQASAATKDPSLCELPRCYNHKRRNSKDGGLYDFCRRAHAVEAEKKGIQVTHGASEQSPDSLCRLDGCKKPKRRAPNGKFFDYCCKDHAEKAKTSATSEEKDDSTCIIPECSRPRYVDSEKKESYYCSQEHVEEGKKRGIYPILTSRNEVDAFLKSFSSTLNVVDVKENDHAKPGGALYKKFMKARDGLPQADRKTCLAFHGTADANIDSICTNGYDPSRRSGQACGPGEYFAVTPATPLGYVKGGKRLLLNELLLGQQGVHHTRHGDYVVMKNPEHDLPRFVITFQ